MIKTTLLYPNREGARFDFDYYQNKHLPFVKGCLGHALKDLSVDRVLFGGAPNSAPPFIVMAHMKFDSHEAFLNAFAPHAEAIANDISNFTDVQPIPMISETLL